MKLDNIKNAANTALLVSKTFVEVNKAKIFVIGGVGMMTTGTGLAVYKTTKLAPVMNDIRTEHTLIKDNKPIDEVEQEVTMPEYRKQLIGFYAKSGLKLAKHYAVPGGLIAGGAGLIFKGCNVFEKDAEKLMATAVGIEAAMTQYRENVIEMEGEEADIKYMSGVHKEMVDEIVTDENGEVVTNKKGEPKTKKVAKEFADPNRFADICAPITITHDSWHGTPDDAITWAKLVQSSLNGKLHTPRVFKNGHWVGYITENEIREAFQNAPVDSGFNIGIMSDPRTNYEVDLDLGLDGINANQELLDDFRFGRVDTLSITPTIIETSIVDGVTYTKRKSLGLITLKSDDNFR